MSAEKIFLISFLGSLFAILVSLLVVYSYVMLRLFPRLKRGVREFVEEVGPRAVFERANVDPAEAMRQLGISPAAAPLAPERQQAILSNWHQIVDGKGGVSPAAAAASFAVASDDVTRRKGAVRVVFTCEDHGRCVGCPKVLAQFEAIVKHQGAENFDEVERKCYEQLCEQLASDALLDGESETDRQKRIAARVIETLVREGCASRVAHAVVWSRKKEDRATFAGWLSVARRDCEKLSIEDEEHVV